MAGFGGGTQGFGRYFARAVAQVQPAQGAAGPGVPGFVDWAGGVGCGGRFVVLDELQAGVFGALQHPLQGDFGELAFGVAAADVGMGAGEPELFEGLVVSNSPT